MSDYTPTTEEVRASYLTSLTHDYPANIGEQIDEFDRWLAGVKAEAVREFIREISAHVEDYISITALDHLAPGGRNDATNPYREERLEE